MPPTTTFYGTFDNTYNPRLWPCGQCGRVLGVVMRYQDRVRRLWVFRVDRAEDEVPTTFVLHNPPRGLFKVHGEIQCRGVECSICGTLNEWVMTKQSFDQLMAHYGAHYDPSVPVV